MNRSLPPLADGPWRDVVDSHTVVVSTRSCQERHSIGRELQVAQPVGPPHIEASHIVVLGGGASIDWAKRAAAATSARLTIVPTATTTDAWANDVAAVRNASGVDYVETGFADLVLLDEVVMDRAGPLNRWLLGDLLAVGGAATDWRLCQPDAAARSPHHLALAERLFEESAALAVRAEPSNALWRRALCELALLKVQLSCLMGAPVIEEGTEHYLAYRMEALGAPERLHGPLVLTGLLAAMVAQEWTSDRSSLLLRAIVEMDAGDSILALLPYLESALTDLPRYLADHGHTNSVLGSAPVAAAGVVDQLRSALT